jgi:RNA polymerase sigma-70 factor, ECF subfamily
VRQGGQGAGAGLAGTAALQGGRAGSDASLVSAARSGDAAAFGTLYERYRDAVYRYCLARTGSAPDAEDMTSDVFVKALASLDRYQERGLPFLAFLYRIARNAAIDRSRRAKHRSPAEELPADLASDHDVERAGIAGAERAILLAALARLKPAHREVLVLRFIEGYSGPETAALLGRSEGAVRVLQHRATAELRKHFSAAESAAARPVKGT